MQISEREYERGPEKVYGPQKAEGKRQKAEKIFLFAAFCLLLIAFCSNDPSSADHFIATIKHCRLSG